MARKAAEMGPSQVAQLRAPGLHAVGGVSGLALQIAPGGSRSWVLRVTVGGRRREMGLGGFPDVTLAGATDAARTAHAKLQAGLDPIDDAKAAHGALLSSRAKDVGFKECALNFIETHEAGWSTPRHDQWISTLEAHVFPLIGHLVVRDIGLSNVLAVLSPIWHEKAADASRVRSRIERILDWARVRGLRSGDNPAEWNDHLELVLGAPGKNQQKTHFRALPGADMQVFMTRLRTQRGIGAIALRFAILTAARSAEIRGATWNEFDLDNGVWVIPKERMRAGKEHCVPLSSGAKSLLESREKTEGCALVFPSSNGAMISDATMNAVLHRMGVDAVQQGFRASFRDWCSGQTNYPKDVCEMALGHASDNNAEPAHRQGVLFEERRGLMQDWADFCGEGVPPTGNCG